MDEHEERSSVALGTKASQKKWSRLLGQARTSYPKHSQVFNDDCATSKEGYLALRSIGQQLDST